MDAMQERLEDIFGRLEMAHLSLVIGPKPKTGDWDKLNEIEDYLEEYRKQLERVRALRTLSEDK